jgi:uncharacterized spore protein YtfJ
VERLPIMIVDDIVDVVGDAPQRTEEVLMDAKTILSKVGENLSVTRSFGPAYEKDGLLIIPVALVAGGGGGGGSSVTSSTDDDANETPDVSPSAGGPTGSGGGFGGLVMPVGTYVVKGDDVRWVPAVNVTMIAMAAFAVLRLALRTKSRRRRRG